MKIDINKKYRTKEGYDVKFLHRVPDGWPTQYPWRGVIGDGNQMSWTDDGRQDVDQSPNDDDLIEVREPREWWANVYLDGQLAIHNSEQDARTACAVDGQTIRVREIIE